MRRLTPLIILMAALSPQILFGAETSPESKHVIDSAIGAILHSDGVTARELFKSLPPETLDPRDMQLRNCALARLDGDVSDGLDDLTPKAQHILKAYRIYWRAAMLHPDDRDGAEKVLIRTLKSSLGREDFSDFAAIETRVADVLKQEGYWSLQGKTGLLHELMIWSKQDDRTYSVDLPDGKHVTRVFALDQFASLGWSSYFTCERSGTGGWTKPEGLYAVVPAYESLDDENFRVNFLAHESQHYADNERFPDLESWEKEYRAKLVEVALAYHTRSRILRRFAADQGDDTQSPHSYANKRVLIALRTRLGLPPDADLDKTEIASLRAAAADELRADTERRSK